MKRLSAEALVVLGAMNVEGDVARIDTKFGQLERKLYGEVNRALEALGGKWNRKVGGHVFDGEPEEALTQVVNNGGFMDKKQELGFFQTPSPIADRLCTDACTSDGTLTPDRMASTARTPVAVTSTDVT